MPVQQSFRFADGSREISKRCERQQSTAKEREGTGWSLYRSPINYRFGSRLSERLNPDDNDELTLGVPSVLKRNRLPWKCGIKICTLAISSQNFEIFFRSTEREMKTENERGKTIYTYLRHFFIYFTLQELSSILCIV